MKRSRTGAADVAASLRREITEGGLCRNDRLPAERDLARDFRVSRGTIRRAIDRLKTERLVETRRGSGTYIRQVTGDHSATALFQNARPLELVDARFALEPHICRLAVLHGRRSDFADMEDLLVRMESSSDDPITFAETDRVFHETLARATGNLLLVWMITNVNRVRHQEEWRKMRETTLNRQTILHYNSQHRRILNAIRAREPERAAALMKDHLETARLSLTRVAAT